MGDDYTFDVGQIQPVIFMSLSTPGLHRRPPLLPPAPTLGPYPHSRPTHFEALLISNTFSGERRHNGRMDEHRD